jgi:microcystin-dependent protein
MGTPYLGEIKFISWNFAPKGWAFCNGAFLAINQNQALFSLLGTMYGGNGQTTFALPDLRGRTPIHMGSGFTEGQAGGQEFHTVIMSEMPQHLHTANAEDVQPTAGNPAAGRMLSQSKGAFLFAAATNLQAMSPQNISNTGGSQPHENRQPFLVLNAIIALQGVFPSQN